MRIEPGGGGLSVGSCYCNDRDPSLAAAWKQHVHNRFSHISGNAIGRCQVHTESWCSIHFENDTAVISHGFRDIRAHDIDPANVQANQARNAFSSEDIIRMHMLCYIGCSSAG